ESHPVLTADGATIVYATHVRGGWEIWRMNVDGSQRRQLAAAPIVFQFAVTPDSKSVVYASSDEARGGSTLTRVPLDGGTSSVIARIGVFVRSLQLTPDGGAVVFSALEQTSVKLFRVAIGGGAIAKLLPGAASDGVVSPDGK